MEKRSVAVLRLVLAILLPGCVADTTLEEDVYAAGPLRYVTASVRSFGYGGGTGRIDVVVPAGEAWSATTSDGWISITRGAGAGNGSVEYRLPTSYGAARLGRITVAGQTVTVMQQGYPYAGDGFEDLPVSAEHATYAYLMRELGITRGCQGPPSAWRYCPGDPATRGQVAVFIVRALQVRAGLGPDAFASAAVPYFPADVPATHPFFRHVQRLRELGLTSGCGTDAFCPDQPITAGMMAAFVARAAAGGDGFEYPGAPYFSDVPAGHTFFRHVQRVRALAVWDGCGGGRFCPDQTLTRGQVAAFIMRGFLDAPRENGQCNLSCGGHVCGTSDGCGATCESGSGCVVATDDGTRAAVTGATYVGCFTDGSASSCTDGSGATSCLSRWPNRRALDTFLLRNPTVEGCIAAARDRGFLYAGLQNGDECWGGNVLGWNRTFDGECRARCAGDPSRYECGGRWLSAVYATRPLDCSSNHDAFHECLAGSRCQGACDMGQPRDQISVYECSPDAASAEGKRRAYEAANRRCRERTGADCCCIQYYFVSAETSPGRCSGWWAIANPSCRPPMCIGGPIGSGTGLRAEYFRDMAFGSLAFSRTDPVVDLYLGNRGPDPSMPADRFSVRWTGQIEPRFSEVYRFHVLADDGVRLTVDGRVLIDDLASHPLAYQEAIIALTAGRRYDIRLEYVEDAGEAIVQLQWSSPSQYREVVRTSQLYPTVTPPIVLTPRIDAIVNAATGGPIRPGDVIAVLGSGFNSSGNIVELTGPFGTTYDGWWSGSWSESPTRISFALPTWVDEGTVTARVWDGDEFSPAASFTVLP